MRSRLTSRQEGAMALLPLQKLLAVKSTVQSMRDTNDDLRFMIKASHRSIAEAREALATANKVLAQDGLDRRGPPRR